MQHDDYEVVERVLLSLVLVVAAVLSAVPAALASSNVDRAQYAAELHRIDAPLLTLYDAYYLFTGGGHSVRWVTGQTLTARRQVAVEVQRLGHITPPASVLHQHRQIIAALKRLRSDLERPISFADKGHAQVLGWWLQTYGALPEIKTLGALHASLSRTGYWK